MPGAATQLATRCVLPCPAAANLASRLYSTSKAYVPERLAGTVAAAESRVAAAAQPYVPALLDKGTSALQAVDAKVG